jgi:hypothetical protein
MPKTVKLEIELEGSNSPLLEVTRVTAVNFKDRLGRIYLEEMAPGEWRLTYCTRTIPDIKKLTALKLHREVE